MFSRPVSCPVLHAEDIALDDKDGFSLVPTLQHMAAVKIASRLWATEDISDEISQWVEENNKLLLTSFWAESHVIEERASELPLPILYIPHVEYVVNRMAREVFEWMELQMRLDASFEPWYHLHRIQWTYRGRVDGDSTAEIIMSTDDVQDKYRSQASKYYCLNLSGVDLFNQANENSSVLSFYDYPSHSFVPSQAKDKCSGHQLETYLLLSDWTPQTTLQVQGPPFSTLVSFISEKALKRIWALFASGTKLEILGKFRFDTIKCNVDSLCFLLSQMDPEVRREFFRSRATDVLPMLFKDWLWQDSFLPALKEIFPGNPNCQTMQRLLTNMEPAFLDYLQVTKNKKILIKMLDFAQHYDAKKVPHLSMVSSIFKIFFCDANREGFKHLIMLYIDAKMDKRLLSGIIHHAVRQPKYNFVPLLKFVVNQIFDTQQEIEDHFVLSNFYLSSIWKIVKCGCLNGVKDFINIFLLDKTKIDELNERIIENHFSAHDFNSSLFSTKNAWKGSSYETWTEMLDFFFRGDSQAVLEFKEEVILSQITPVSLAKLVDNEDNLVELENFYCFIFGREEGVLKGQKELMNNDSSLKKMILQLFPQRNKEIMNELVDWVYTTDEVAKQSFIVRLKKSTDFRKERLFWDLANSNYPILKLFWRMESNPNVINKVKMLFQENKRHIPAKAKKNIPRIIGWLTFAKMCLLLQRPFLISYFITLFVLFTINFFSEMIINKLKC